MMKQGFTAGVHFEASAAAEFSGISRKRRQSLNRGGISGHKH
jgi:hypothetical protein